LRLWKSLMKADAKDIGTKAGLLKLAEVLGRCC